MSHSRHMVELSSIEFDCIGALERWSPACSLASPTARTTFMLELFHDTLADPHYDTALFTLKHPDLNSQNVFVDDETGEISALVDWDGVAVLPRQLGALGCPARLTVE
ncbi:hypothetical protein EXIGLDRAFT_697764 [Exidia glandulosa HHB12029]|uniref:Aminoglycoside phosphotransferase domain-containing protein n=1 Tax=Exidia glandulosa HHB12029 TaxID=1314781 RepID=A0A165ELC0_EXIGL|nr:hypothetical protein EXIGLDRAFT_697764 [Exidia glandulosa HHB12029]